MIIKKLNDKQWHWWLKRVNDMVNEEHQDFNVEILLADLWLILSEGYIWQIPKLKWRQWKLERAIKRHKSCCDLE